MIPRFEHKDTFTVVGIARQFTMSNNTIPQLWDDFIKRDGDIPNSINTMSLGVCYYEPNYESGKDIPFTYMAGRMVSRVEDIPAGMTAHTLPACDYAVFEHVGSLESLRKTYDYIFRVWLPASEYNMAGCDDFELYDARFKYGQPDSIIEI